MAVAEQDLLRLARLTLEGVDPADICDELQISERTMYRWVKRADYLQIRDKLRGPVVSAEHPDVVAARDLLGRAVLSRAQQIEKAGTAGLGELLRRLETPGELGDSALIAAVKLMLDEHRIRVGGEAATGDAPLSAAEVAEVRKMTGAA